jgi:hypothetical protein
LILFVAPVRATTPFTLIATLSPAATVNVMFGVLAAETRKVGDVLTARAIGVESLVETLL